MRLSAHTCKKTPDVARYSAGNRRALSGSLGGEGVNNSERNEHDEPSPQEGHSTARAAPACDGGGRRSRSDRTRAGAGGRGSALSPCRAWAGEARASHPARERDRSERCDRASARGRQHHRGPGRSRRQRVGRLQLPKGRNREDPPRGTRRRRQPAHRRHERCVHQHHPDEDRRRARQRHDRGRRR